MTYSSNFFKKTLLGFALLCLSISTYTQVSARSIFIPPTTGPTTIQVNTTSTTYGDDGFCTLDEAIEAAIFKRASGTLPGECVAGTWDDTIQIPAGTYQSFPRISGFYILGDTEKLTLTGAGTLETIVQIEEDFQVGTNALSNAQLNMKNMTIAAWNIAAMGNTGVVSYGTSHTNIENLYFNHSTLDITAHDASVVSAKNSTIDAPIIYNTLSGIILNLNDTSNLQLDTIKINGSWTSGIIGTMLDASTLQANNLDISGSGANGIDLTSESTGDAVLNQLSSYNNTGSGFVKNGGGSVTLNSAFLDSNQNGGIQNKECNLTYPQAASLYVNDSVIANNTLQNDDPISGAAITSCGHVEVRRTLIQNNTQPSIPGSQIFLRSTTPSKQDVIENSILVGVGGIVVGNYGDYSSQFGFGISYSNPSPVNALLQNNTIVSDLPGISVEGADTHTPTLLLRNNLLSANSTLPPTCTDFTGTITASNNVADYPCGSTFHFVSDLGLSHTLTATGTTLALVGPNHDIPVSTLPLLASSVLINAGTNCPTSDIFGVTRTNGCDIGAVNTNLLTASVPASSSSESSSSSVSTPTPIENTQTVLFSPTNSSSASSSSSSFFVATVASSSTSSSIAASSSLSSSVTPTPSSSASAQSSLSESDTAVYAATTSKHTFFDNWWGILVVIGIIIAGIIIFQVAARSKR